MSRTNSVDDDHTRTMLVLILSDLLHCVSVRVWWSVRSFVVRVSSCCRPLLRLVFDGGIFLHKDSVRGNNFDLRVIPSVY